MVDDDLPMVIGSPRLPTWNTSGRPTGGIGIYGYNTDTDKIEFIMELFGMKFHSLQLLVKSMNKKCGGKKK
jgi:hypothetical protein